MCVGKLRGADQPLQVAKTEASSARQGVGLVKVGVGEGRGVIVEGRGVGGVMIGNGTAYLHWLGGWGGRRHNHCLSEEKRLAVHGRR